MYLLDSIVKNVGENYKPLFAKNLSTTFKMSFDSADDKSKMSLYKLRTTWDDHFPLRKLHSLDMAIKAQDPNWPVKSLPPHLQDGATSNIHVNPKFIKKEAQQPTISASAPRVAKKNVTRPTVVPAPQSTEVDKIQQQLVRQQKELLDLQQKRLMLELEQTKRQLEAKQKEAQHTVSKKQDKMPRDPRAAVPPAVTGTLKVTVTNAKATSAVVSQKQTTSKDPRLKVMPSKKVLSNEKVTPEKKSSIKAEIPKANENQKKKPLKSLSKKDKHISSSDNVVVASKTDLVKSSSMKLQQEKPKVNVTAIKKSKDRDTSVITMNETDRCKKRSYRNKLSRSPTPPPSKVPRRSNSPVKFSDDNTLGIRRDRLNDPRRQRSHEKKNQRIRDLKVQSQDSSRSSDGSLSPRFSPEPDADVSSMMKSNTKPQFDKKNDALRRRPSFDPDLHIPQELTLSHQNEILKQADHQLRSGQLTHEQHQELLKQLHQLFEMQRIRKIQSDIPVPIDPRMHRVRSRSPLDPRKERRNKNYRPAPDEVIRRRTVPDNFNDHPDDISRDRHHDPHLLPGNKPLPNRTGRGKARLPNLPRRPIRNQELPANRNMNEIRKPSPHDVRHRNLEGAPLHVRRRPGSGRPPSPRRGPPRLSPPPFLSIDRSNHSNELVPTRLSTPPFLQADDNSSQKNKVENRAFHEEKLKEINANGKHKNLRRFAHGDLQRKSPPFRQLTPGSQHKNEDLIANHANSDPRRLRRKPHDDVSVSIKAEEKVCLEEPEEYIIANIPKGAITEIDETKKTREVDDTKDSCEEPEDFIIAQMPPGAVAYHNHSIGLKRNTDSEKAYLEHMKKIKQSMYTKELNKVNKSNKSESTSEENTTEKVVEAESASKKSEELMKSPPLPIKKRRYISSEGTTDQKKDAAPLVEDTAVEDTTDKKSPLNIKAENVTNDKGEEKLDQHPTEVQPELEKQNDSSETDSSTPVEEKQKTDEMLKTKSNKKIITKDESIPTRTKSTEPVNKDVLEKNDKEDRPLIYVIDDETSSDVPSRNDPRDIRESRAGRERRPPPRHKDWHHEKPTYGDEEEARLQRMMEDEKKQLEWEDNLHRELAMEHWKEERMRRMHRDRLSRGRGGHFPPPDRWESPPRDVGEPFDIARGKLRGRPRGLPPRPPPRRHEDIPLRRGHLYPPAEELRGRRPREDLKGPPPPGEQFRERFPPGWEGRRPRSPPPGHRLPPPPPHMHDVRDERRPDWDRHLGRLPPREPPFHPDDHRPPPTEHRRFTPEPVSSPPINQLNVNKLLTDLVSMGIIPGSKKEESKSASPAPESSKAIPAPTPTASVKAEAVSVAVKSEEAIRAVSPFIDEDLMTLDPDAQVPVITLTSDLKVRHDEIIKRLYTGIQCSACGLRFTTRQTDLYADHLDWHYRLNRKEKEGGALTHRELYPTAGEWICYEEIQNPEERSKNPFLDEAENVDSASPAVKAEEEDLTVPLTGQPDEDTCKVCKEAFETFYNEADDEWQFANCIKVDNDNFHPNCYGDHYDLTPLPTPIKTPMYNPLDDSDGIPGLGNVAVKEESSRDNETVGEAGDESENMQINTQEDTSPLVEGSVVEIDENPVVQTSCPPSNSDNLTNCEETVVDTCRETVSDSVGDVVEILEDETTKSDQDEQQTTVSEENVASQKMEVSEEPSTVDDVISTDNEETAIKQQASVDGLTVKSINSPAADFDAGESRDQVIQIDKKFMLFLNATI